MPKRVLSAKHREALSAANRGRHLSPLTEFKKGMTAWNKGRVCPELRGAKNPSWNGGRTTANGYILLYRPEHPCCNTRGYVYEHRLIVERRIERYLKPEEVVHHKGVRYALGSLRNKQDNLDDNLQLFMNGGEHQQHHAALPKRWTSTADACVSCQRATEKHHAKGLCVSCYNRWYNCRFVGPAGSLR